jgi:hypothetical protein
MDKRSEPFSAIIDFLKDYIFDRMEGGLTREAIHVEVASAPDAVVVRVRHYSSLVTGDDWLAVFPITTTWRSDSKLRVELSNQEEITDRYEAQLGAAIALGMLHEKMMPNARKLWRYVGVTTEVATRAVKTED